MSPTDNRVSRQALQVIALSLACLLPVTATSALIGIDVLSENHRIWGSAGYGDEFGSTRSTYDISSSHGPISYQAEGTDCSWVPIYDECDPSIAESSAGSFSVETYALRWAGDAYAESRYTFSPEFSSLTIDVDAYDWSTHQQVDMRLALSDITEDRGMYAQDFTWLWGEGASIGVIGYQLLFDVNPLNEYALELYVSSHGGDSEAISRLSARPSSVPVSEPGSIGLLLGAMLALIYIRSRRRLKG